MRIEVESHLWVVGDRYRLRSVGVCIMFPANNAKELAQHVVCRLAVAITTLNVRFSYRIVKYNVRKASGVGSFCLQDSVKHRDFTSGDFSDCFPLCVSKSYGVYVPDGRWRLKD